jgi:hypothetical protein
MALVADKSAPGKRGSLQAVAPFDNAPVRSSAFRRPFPSDKAAFSTSLPRPPKRPRRNNLNDFDGAEFTL